MSILSISSSSGLSSQFRFFKPPFSVRGHVVMKSDGELIALSKAAHYSTGSLGIDV